MPDLKPLTALGDTRPHVDTIGEATITEVADVALASVAARTGGAAATERALKQMTGAAAPGPGRIAGEGEIAVLWSGPDQWLAMAPMQTHELIADMMRAAVKGKASVTEQSGAWVRFDLAGAARIDVLERLCPLPVRRMQPGDASRGRIEHLTCFVICHSDRFCILGPASSAMSLHHALVTAARSVA